MKRPWDEALDLMLSPDELLARITTLVPPPRTHALRYHGLFAPNSKHRARVVPGREHRRAQGPSEQGHADAPPAPSSAPLIAPSVQLTAPAAASRRGPRTRVPWAELLRKVFAREVLECPRCAGRLEVIAYIAEPTVARRILDHLGLASQGPPVAKAGSATEDPGCDPGPDYAAADPIYDE